MKKKALILGITGQDGSYMLELLIKKKYEIHGLIRKSATGNTQNIDHIINNDKIFNKQFFLHRGDLLDIGSINTVIKKLNQMKFTILLIKITWVGVLKFHHIRLGQQHYL